MANSDDELAYLQPDFVLSSLTMPKLRSILVSHDISYPASAKKNQLIELIEEKVLPQSRKLLSARARNKRTSKGIIDMPSSQESAAQDETDEETMPPPPVPAKTPRGRKSKASLAAEAAARASAPSTPATARAKTPKGRPSSKHARMSDTEEEADQVRSTARKVRKSGVAPAVTPAHVRLHEPDLPLMSSKKSKDESPFTDDNPFQTGSSPSADQRRISGSTSRPRSSFGKVKDDRRKSSSRRRKSTPPVDASRAQEGVRVPSRSTFEFPASKINRDEVEPTEEFTPEAELELASDRAAQGRALTSPRSRVIRRKPASGVTKTATWGVFLSVVGTITAWYRSEKVNIGYCGVGEPEWSLSKYDTNIPVWAKEYIHPVCEPCPQHATCFPRMEVTCDSDYILRPHPLSLGGVVPLPPACEPDGEKTRRVKAVADRAVEELRQRRAAFECGGELKDGQACDDEKQEGQSDASQTPSSKLPIAESALKAEVSQHKRKGMSDAEFEDLWTGALEDISGREDVEVIQDGPASTIYFVSHSYARLPLSCALRLNIVSLLSRYRRFLLTITGAVCIVIYARNRFLTNLATSRQVPSLADNVLDRLAMQAALHDARRADDEFISAVQLRDTLLRSLHSLTERERIWSQVTKVVEQNSNIRCSERAGRKGEWSRVWEWIGPTENIELSPIAGAERRRTRSRSRSPVKREQLQNSGSVKSEMVQRKKWEETQPGYY